MYNTLQELPAFLASLYLGMLIGAAYCIVECFKGLFSARWPKAVVDGVFWLVAGCLFALAILFINGGMIRLYLILATILGTVLFSSFVGRPCRKMFDRGVSFLKKAKKNRN